MFFNIIPIGQAQAGSIPHMVIDYSSSRAVLEYKFLHFQVIPSVVVVAKLCFLFFISTS